MALLIMYDAATAIQEQTNRRLFPFRISEGERDSWVFFNFWCCQEIWSRLNRTSHPDWVKMFGDTNSQSKLRAKQKYKFLSATYYITMGKLFLSRIVTWNCILLLRINFIKYLKPFNCVQTNYQIGIITLNHIIGYKS